MNTIIAYTTIEAGTAPEDWPEDTFLWTDIEAARDNAEQGGHHVVRLVLKVRDAKVVESYGAARKVRP